MSTTRRRTLLGRGRHDGGASAVEYALILAGVAILSIGAIFALGRTAKTAFTNATSVVSTQPAGVLPVVSESTTPAPGPTTPTASPSSSSPAPIPTPTTTNRARSVTLNGTDTDPILDLQDDLNLPNNAVITNASAAMTDNIGTVSWNGTTLEFNPNNSLQRNRTYTTTVTYTYTYNGTVYTGTISVTVRT